MENDEKKKKVIDELKRRKKIVEDYLDSIDDSSKDFDPYGYAIHKNWSFLIDKALGFAKKDSAKYNIFDYSNHKSYDKSINECWGKLPMSMIGRIASGEFNWVISYIGTVIDDINSNHYPNGYSEIFNELED